MSGGKLPDIYLALVDKYGQIVGSDSESRLTVINDPQYNEHSQYNVLLEGTIQYTALYGMFMINDLNFTSEPGTNNRIKFSTNGIDITKPSINNYIKQNGITDIEFNLNIELRECIAGEYFSDSGK